MLETEGLTRSFGELTAVDHMDFRVEADRVTSLIGPNGAGKSTLFNLICGLLRPDHGRIVFDGEDITGLAPHQVTRRGIGRSFQIVDVFEGLTVRENVRLAAQALDGRKEAVWRRADTLDGPLAATEALLEEMGLAAHADSRADALSHGNRRKLDIAVTFATEPRLVLLDEPTAGLGKDESMATVELIRELAATRGLTLVLIEHDVEIVLGISDVITVMHEGSTLARGSPAEIRDSEEVQRAYLGTEAS